MQPERGGPGSARPSRAQHGIVKVGRLDWEELDAFLAGAAGASFYQTSTWLRGLVAVYGFRLGWYLRRQGGEIEGLLPFADNSRYGLVHRQSLPFGTYGGPALAATADPDLGPALIARFLADCGGRRHRLSLVTPPDPAAPAGPAAAPARLATQILDLRPGWETVYAEGFAKERRRQVHKALREGVIIARSAEPADLAAYHRIYLEHARGWGLARPTPLAHLEQLVADSERVRFWVARHQGRLIGGHLNFHFQRAVIAWNGCASKADRELAPSVMLYAMNLEQACADGERSFNFGGSGGKDPLFAFKAAFGAQPVHYGFWRRESALLGLLSAGRAR
jgi:CelD/BcsL family acetyltransferase involved in cellulose biosynthesis